MSFKLRYRVLRDCCKSFFSKPETWSYVKILGVTASPSSRYHKQGQKELARRISPKINKVIENIGNYNNQLRKSGLPENAPSIPIETYFDEPK